MNSTTGSSKIEYTSRRLRKSRFGPGSPWKDPSFRSGTHTGSVTGKDVDRGDPEGTGHVRTQCLSDVPRESWERRVDVYPSGSCL